MYALYVKPNSKEMISISLARCQEIFFFWKDMRGQGQVESTPLVFGIWCFWFWFFSRVGIINQCLVKTYGGGDIQATQLER